MHNKKLFVFFAFPPALLIFVPGDAAAQRGPRQEKLLNGLKVLLWPNPAADNVELKLRIHAGSSFDPQGREGTMKMLAETMFPDQAARDFFVEDLGGTLSITTTYDYIQLDATSKPEHYLTMLEMIATAVSGPVIDRETTGKVRAMVIAEQKRHAADAGYIADMTAAKRLLGTFPYGRPILGTENTLAKVDFADIRFNYDRLFGADNATLALSGRFDSNTSYRAVRRFFGNWLKSDETIPATFKQPGPPPTEAIVQEDPSAERSEIRYATRGVSRGSKDYAAAEVLTRIYESRLKAQVPAERQNNVFVRNEPRFLPGLIIFGMSDGETDTAGFKQAMMDAPVTDLEFNAHRVAASSKRNAQDGVTQWLDADTYRLASVKADADAFTEVTLADVRALADRFKSAPMVTVAIVPPAAPEPQPASDNSETEQN